MTTRPRPGRPYGHQPANPSYAVTPAERHAAVLAGLDRLDAALAASSPAPWRWLDELPPDAPRGPGSGLVTDADDLPPADVEAILLLRNSAAAVLAGRRRIIERHAPHRWPDGVVWCRECAERADWPCVDYRDAAADLLPDGESA